MQMRCDIFHVPNRQSCHRGVRLDLALEAPETLLDGRLPPSLVKQIFLYTNGYWQVRPPSPSRSLEVSAAVNRC